MPIEQHLATLIKFSAFEQSGWDANIKGYDSALGAVARQTVGPMLDAACVARDMRVLRRRVCGPGMLAAGALQRRRRGGRARCSPLKRLNSPAGWSPTAVSSRATLRPCRSRRRASMPCSAAMASCTCRTRRPLFANMLRVLRPGGRAAVSVWDAAGAGLTLVYEAVRARGSMDGVALPHGPDFFQFGSAERMLAGLAEAGFSRRRSAVLAPGLALSRR